jgi:N-acetylmuramoyl-L-alanine amidase
MDDTTLPSGEHWGLNIDVAAMTSTGAYVPATPKLIWHTTEGSDFNEMVRVLIRKAAQPHAVIDPHSGHVRQMIPLNQYARALEHPPGTPETNRAHCIQVEICGFAKASATWPDSYYKHLGALAVLLEHRQGIARISTQPFSDTPHRLAPAAFISAKGHLGHEHVPSQPSGHWDPGALDIDKLFACMHAAEQQYH